MLEINYAEYDLNDIQLSIKGVKTLNLRINHDNKISIVKVLNPYHK